MPQRMRMTEERKAAFLEHLRKYGLVTQAAKHASPGSPLGCTTSFNDERGRDPEFAAAWEQAIEESEEELLRQLRERGLDGIVEDVYGSLGPNQGTGIVGQRKVYSDKMAELYARVHSARVRHGLANKVELSGTVRQENELNLANLTPKQQELLRQLLESDDEAE